MSSDKGPISVVAAYYEDPVRAHEALATLQSLRKRRAIEILDAAVMARVEGSKNLQITETAELSAKKAGLVGAVAAGAAVAHFTDQGFDNNLLKEIGENLPPGGAALVAVIEEKWLAGLSETLSDYSSLSRFAMKPELAAQLTSDAG